MIANSPSSMNGLQHPPSGEGRVVNHPVSFGLVVPSVYGPILANRYDTNQTTAIIRTGRAPHHGLIMALCRFLDTAPKNAVALDVGANFGLFALAFGRCLAPRNGCVHAFEAQRMIAYLAAGTIGLNGIENVFIHHQAVGDHPGRIPMPQFDYNTISSFGSIEFGPVQGEFVGQPRQMQPDCDEWVEVVRLDDLKLKGVHLAKIDVEGMEQAVLSGATQIIERDGPVLCIEHLKSEKSWLVDFCKQFGYRVFDSGSDLLCVHRDKQSSYRISISLPEC